MIAYTMGMFDILRMKDLRDLDRNIQLSKQEGHQAFALGIYTEELWNFLNNGSLCYGNYFDKECGILFRCGKSGKRPERKG